jgi:hypothetical protein
MKQEKLRADDVNEGDVRSRRFYEPPRLQLLGSLSSLTQSTGGPAKDAVLYFSAPSAGP